MASSWRSPYPKQQNPGLAYQERPVMLECPDHPNPSPRLTNRPPFPYVPQGGAPIEAHWYQYAPMTSSGTYVPPLMQPPLTNIPNWTLINPFNPTDNSHCAMLEDQPPVEIPGQGMTMTEWGMTAIGGMADHTIFNQPPSAINMYDMAQPGPSQMMNPWETCPDGVMPPTSLCMMSTVLESRLTAVVMQPMQYEAPESEQWVTGVPLPKPALEAMSSSTEDSETDEGGPIPPPLTGRCIPVPQRPKPQAIIRTPMPQRPMSRATRVLLQRQYDVYPEVVERHLRELQNEKPTTERYKQLMDDLHTQLYDVPAKLCMLKFAF
ncbi:hypothetical protein ABVT39_003488 [Epinephelus coioides]